MVSARAKVLASILIEKKAFAPGGEMGGQPPMDPAAGGAPMAGPPMDPAQAGGAPMAGPPMDPAAGGAPMNPAMDPAAGGQGMGGEDPMMMPISMLTVGDLIGLVGEVVTQAIGGGAPEGAAPAPEAAPEGAGAEGDSLEDDDVVGRLDQILELLSATVGAPAGDPAMAAPMGPDAGAAPMGGAPKMASTKVGGTSIADMILDKVSEL